MRIGILCNTNLQYLNVFIQKHFRFQLTFTVQFTTATSLLVLARVVAWLMHIISFCANVLELGENVSPTRKYRSGRANAQYTRVGV